MQEMEETQVQSWVRKIPWRRALQPTQVFLPGESHGQGAWQATVHRAAESWTWLTQRSMHVYILVNIIDIHTYSHCLENTSFFFILPFLFQLTITFLSADILRQIIRIIGSGVLFLYLHPCSLWQLKYLSECA